jgi:hypothetical protein
MQIDFHHAVTYIVSRCAGLSHDQAAIVGYSAQYVDDATNGGTIEFDIGAKYSRISSAHRTFDYRNFGALANHRVWIPFHFLPANDGLPPGENPDGKFIEKLICRPAPRNPVAADMLRSAIEDRTRPYGLHRWGITMHVYADTWAHQGFAGVNHKVNEVHEISFAGEEQEDRSLWSRVTEWVSERTSDAFPLGHGAALSAPDRPYLSWSYKNGRGEVIQRNNTKDFLEAAQYMCIATRRYVLGDPDAEVQGLDPEDAEQIGTLLSVITGTAEERHAAWAKAAARGVFSFGAVELPTFIAKGVGSWKHTALAIEKAHDEDHDAFSYGSEFLTSDWKRFHDASQKHKFAIVHEILPPYGICTA